MRLFLYIAGYFLMLLALVAALLLMSVCLERIHLSKAMIEIHGDKVDKKLCKEAIKVLINSGRCVYTYFGGSFIELPHKEGAAN